MWHWFLLPAFPLGRLVGHVHPVVLEIRKVNAHIERAIVALYEVKVVVKLEDVYSYTGEQRLLSDPNLRLRYKIQG
jgi:hypothetical protein